MGTLRGMDQWWSWLLSAVGVTGLWVAGSGRRAGWLIGLGAQGLWITYALVSEQYGFIAASLAYGTVQTRNWWRARPATAEEAKVEVEGG